MKHTPLSITIFIAAGELHLGKADPGSVLYPAWGTANPSHNRLALIPEQVFGRRVKVEQLSRFSSSWSHSRKEIGNLSDRRPRICKKLLRALSYGKAGPIFVVINKYEVKSGSRPLEWDKISVTFSSPTLSVGGRASFSRLTSPHGLCAKALNSPQALSWEWQRAQELISPLRNKCFNSRPASPISGHPSCPWSPEPRFKFLSMN